MRPADDTDDALIGLGAALELVQACALVHDDIIDIGHPARPADGPSRLRRDTPRE